MHRSGSGKRLELTYRDLEIFKLLERYRYLRSTYIHAFVGGASQTRFKERLGDLFHKGYLDRPARQWDFADARHWPAIHEIGQGATRILRQAALGSGDRRDFLSEIPHRQFLHAVMICEVLASLDLGARSDPSLRFIAWPEILARAPEASRGARSPFRAPLPAGGYLVPDGLFGVEYSREETKAYRFFALEADRGTMPVVRSDPKQSSYMGKLAAYRQIIAQRVFKTHWGLPNLLVLTVTTSQSRMTDIVSKLDGEADTSAFLFRAVTEQELSRPTAGLLSQPWQRPGTVPLRIDQTA